MHNPSVDCVVLFAHSLLVLFNRAALRGDLVNVDMLGLSRAAKPAISLFFSTDLPPRSTTNDDVGGLNIQTLSTSAAAGQHDSRTGARGESI